MPKKTKIHDEPTEEYKAQLAAKEAQKAKEEMARKESAIRKKRAETKAKREMETRKRELKVELANKKIAECNAEIAKAEKVLENEKVYDSLAQIALGAFAIMLVVSMIVFFMGLGANVLLVSMIITFVIICLSIFFQAKPGFAKKEIRDNRRMIRKIRQELLK